MNSPRARAVFPTHHNYTVTMELSKLKESSFWNKKLDKCIATFDANKNGRISRRDFLLVRENFSQQNVSKKHFNEFVKSLEKFLDNVDLKDNSVSYTHAEMKEKFIHYFERVSGGIAILIENTFKSLDIDNNGVISFEEWKLHYLARGIPIEYARTSFDAIDQDKDGNISMKEFVAYHYEFYYTVEDKLSSSILFGPLD